MYPDRSRNLAMMLSTSDSMMSLYSLKSKIRLLILILIKSILASVSVGDWASSSFSNDGVLDSSVCGGVLGVGGRLGGPIDVDNFGVMEPRPILILIGWEIDPLPLPNGVVGLGLVPVPIG